MGSDQFKTAKGTANGRKQMTGHQRRELLVGAGCCAGLLALGAGVKLSSAGGLIRPPGADAAHFFERCIKCGRCIAACPTRVIAAAGIEAGPANLRTPFMDYHSGYCDFCRKCIEACPTGALAGFEGETTVIGIAKLNSSCIALRTGGCTKCEESCPYDAITLDEMSRPMIDSSICNGCGKCVWVCPAHVLQSFSSDGERGIAVHSKTEFAEES